MAELNDHTRLALLQAMLATMEDGVIAVDREFNIILANAWIESKREARAPLAGQKCYSALFDRAESCPSCPFVRSLETKIPQRQTVKIPSGQGGTVWLELRAYPLPGPAGAIAGAIEHIKDVTARRQVEEELRHEELRSQVVFSQLPDGVVVYDANGKVCETNERFAKMLGYTMDEVLQLHVWDLDTQSDRERLLSLLQRAGIMSEEFETCYRRKDGTLLTADVCSTGAIVEGNLMVFHACRDISDLKAMQKQIKEMDTCDHSTDLYSRRHIFERLEAISAEYCRGRGDFVIAILGIDDIGSLKSFMGHVAGDTLLRELARLLKDALRPYDLLGRYGTDEFILVSRNASEAETSAMMDRLLELVRKKYFSFEGSGAYVKLNCGLSRSSEFARQDFTLDPMVALAEQRRKEAAASGGDRWVGPLPSEASGGTA